MFQNLLHKNIEVAEYYTISKFIIMIISPCVVPLSSNS